MLPEQSIQTDTATSTAFLREISQGWSALPEPVALELRCLMPERTPDISRFGHDEAGIAALVQHASAMNAAGLNCYIVVNPVRASAPLRRDGKLSGAMDEDILAAFYFWADGDDEQAAHSIRNFAGPKYTMAVMTGTVPSPRPHVYWRCADGPMYDLAQWTVIQRGIARVLSTDRTVVNPSRIMRLPGTINIPTKAKALKGRVPELTTFRSEYPDARPPVTLEQMQRVFGAETAQPAAGGLHIDTGSAGDRRTADEYADILRRARTDGEKHGGVRDLAAVLAGSGAPRHLAEAIIRDACPIWDAGVERLIDTAYEKFFKPAATTYTPNFDHAPAPTPSNPAPDAAAWQMQSAADFTAGFVAPEYIVDGVVQRGRLYTLTAPTGSGKTAVMLYAAIAVAQGDLFYDREVEQGDVIFMAGENPDDVRARMIATMEFYGINPARCRVHFIPGTFSIRADMERIRAAAATLPNLVLVVIDTFAAYFDGDDENSNAQAIDFARVARKLTAFPSKPAVVMPAHPVKNATRGNLSPKGGSSLVNEVDGNLTLWNEGGIVTLHWQVKFRGAEFEPLSFELQRYETDLIRDAKGRRMPTILAKPMLQIRAMQIASENLSIEDKLLLSIHGNPALSLAERAVQVGVNHKQKVARLLIKLAEQKLIRKFRTNWELTKEGDRAVEMITSGDRFAPEI